MSTEFVSTTTGEVGFVRWGTVRGEFRTAFEFGTMSNFERVVAWMRAGDTFKPLGGSRLAGDPDGVESLLEMAATGRATFGEFGFTVEVGSGDMFKFGVEL